MLRQDSYCKAHLVTYAWQYAREYGGPLPAQMVMSAIMNRVRCGQGSLLEVIERIPKYAAEVTQLSGFPLIWEPTFVHLLHDVESIYDGSGKDLSGGALYWCDLRRVENEWFKVNILGKQEQHPRVANFNSLTFFR